MNNQVFNGKQFNHKYQGQTFIKLTKQSEIHNRYQFQTGLNIDPIPFNPSGQCQPGGIYFCQINQLSLWLDYSDSRMFYVRSVTIPDDAQVWVETNKFKTDRMILGERMEIGRLEMWGNSSYCLSAVQQKWLCIKICHRTDP